MYELGRLEALVCHARKLDRRVDRLTWNGEMRDDKIGYEKRGLKRKSVSATPSIAVQLATTCDAVH